MEEIFKIYNEIGVACENDRIQSAIYRTSEKILYLVAGEQVFRSYNISSGKFFYLVNLISKTWINFRLTIFCDNELVYNFDFEGIRYRMLKIIRDYQKDKDEDKARKALSEISPMLSDVKFTEQKLTRKSSKKFLGVMINKNCDRILQDLLQSAMMLSNVVMN